MEILSQIKFNGTSGTVDQALVSNGGSLLPAWETIAGGVASTYLKASTIFNFGTNENDFVINTISSAVITNANINTTTFKPSETTETSLDDFTLNGLSFNIENIIDNVSFDIRAIAANNASGNYTINYSIGY